MRRHILVLLAVSLVMGCAATGTPPPGPSVRCPAIRQYTLTEEQAVAQELKKLPSDSSVKRFIDDYGELRVQVRACQNSK